MTAPHIALKWPNPVDPADFDSAYALIVGDGVTGQQYTSSVAQLVAKGANVFNVRTYGAVGDGVTDDTVAIQAAITAAQLVNGAVFIPDGDYLVSATLLVERSIHIEGVSRNSSRIMVKATVDASTDIIKISPNSNTDDNATNGYMFRDFAIEPVSGTPGRHAIALDITANHIAYSIFERLYLRALGGRGIVTLPKTPTPLTDGFFNSTIRDCIIHNGIWMDKAGDHITISGNTIIGASKVAIMLDMVRVSELNTPHGVTVAHNSLISYGGQLLVRNCESLNFVYNLCEFLANPAGLMETTNALVDVEGTASVFGAETTWRTTIAFNHLNSWPGVDVVRVRRGRHVTVAFNTIAEPGGGSFVYKIAHADAVDTELLFNSVSGDSTLASQMSNVGTRTRVMQVGISSAIEVMGHITLTGLANAGYRVHDAQGLSIPIASLNPADNTVSLGSLNPSTPGGNVDLVVNQVIVATLNTNKELLAQGRVVPPAIAVVYSASMEINSRLGASATISVTDAVAFTVQAPTNPRTNATLEITIRNTTAGALGAATWNAAFKLAAWVQPAAGFSRSITFRYNGTNWVEVSRTTADVPN